MAFLGGTFDASQVEPEQSRDPLPAGEYLAHIIDSSMEPTKSNNGQFLKLTYQITDGPMKGRLTWARLNLDNPNEKAVEIAQRQLSAICHACGVLQVSDSTQLHNLSHVIKVDVEQRDMNYAPSNVIKSWRRADGAATPRQAAPAAPAQNRAPFAPPAQQQAPAAQQAPAWARQPA